MFALFIQFTILKCRHCFDELSYYLNFIDFEWNQLISNVMLSGEYVYSWLDIGPMLRTRYLTPAAVYRYITSYEHLICYQKFNISYDIRRSLENKINLW